MKALIIDSNRINRITLMSYLREFSVHYLTAKSTVEGLFAYEKEQPDVIITDLNMENDDVLRMITDIRVRERDDRTYIVVLSTYHDDKHITDAYEAGADGFLAKPFHRLELRQHLFTAARMQNLIDRNLLIHALSQLAEARDQETGTHLIRVGTYSGILATTLRDTGHFTDIIDRAFIEDIRVLSSLHDIGKVGITDAVLKKAGRHEASETGIMRKHVLIGYETIKNIMERFPKAVFLNMATDIIRYHHEWYDGSGYPDGLKKDAIPLSARIVALADVYDALTSDRVYKNRISHDDAKEVLKAASGIQFDPRIIDAFIRSEAAFKAVLDTTRKPQKGGTSRGNKRQ
jgi:putative two-component system response regulator